MSEERPSPKIRLKVVIPLVLGVLVFGLFLAPLGYTAWQFAGGWDGIRPEADPMSPPVVTAREEAVAALPAQQDELDALLTSITGEPLARGTHDGCRRGQNNWKIHDGYTLSCATTVVAVHPWPSDATAFHELTDALAVHGYQPRSEHSALSNPDELGGTGWYSSGSNELFIEIQPPDDPFPSLRLPGSDAHSVDNLYDVDTVIDHTEETILIVTLSSLYFED